MAGKSTFFKHATLQALKDLLPYVAFYTTIPAEDGTGGVEVVAADYARKQPTFTVPALGAMNNTVDIEWAQALNNWGNIVAFGLFDALTVGNLLYFNWLGVGVLKPFTAAATGELFASPAHGYVNSDRVGLMANFGGTLPTGAVATTLYYVIGATTDTFQVSLSLGGAAVDLTTDGTGIAQRVLPKQIDESDQIILKATKLIVTEK